MRVALREKAAQFGQPDFVMAARGIPPRLDSPGCDLLAERRKRHVAQGRKTFAKAQQRIAVKFFFHFELFSNLRRQRIKLARGMYRRIE